MIQNKENFRQSLLCRLEACEGLQAEGGGFKGGAVLLPEILIRTVRDTYRWALDKDPALPAPSLLGELGLELDEAQKALLASWEAGLRSQEKYQALKPESALGLPALLAGFLENFNR